MLKKVFLTLMVVLLSGCNLQQNNETPQKEDNHLLNYMGIEDDLSGIHRIEVFNILGSLNDDDKKIISDPDEVKQILDHVKLMRILKEADESDLACGGSTTFIFYSDDDLIFEFSLYNSKYVSIDTKPFEVSRGKDLYKFYTESEAEIIKVPAVINN